VADVERLDADQVAALERIVTDAEAEWNRRKAYVGARLQEWADDEVACFVAAVAVDGTLEQLRGDDVERLDCLLDALDAGTLRLAYETDTPVLAVTTAAEARLVLRLGGRGPLRDAAKAIAEQHDRPKPRSAAEAVADPVLVAVLAHPPGGRGDEAPTTKEQGASA